MWWLTYIFACMYDLCMYSLHVCMLPSQAWGTYRWSYNHIYIFCGWLTHMIHMSWLPHNHTYVITDTQSYICDDWHTIIHMWWLTHNHTYVMTDLHHTYVMTDTQSYICDEQQRPPRRRCYLPRPEPLWSRAPRCLLLRVSVSITRVCVH